MVAYKQLSTLAAGCLAGALRLASARQQDLRGVLDLEQDHHQDLRGLQGCSRPPLHRLRSSSAALLAAQSPRSALLAGTLEAPSALPCSSLRDASSCSKRWGHLLRQPSRWGILEYLFSFAFAEVVRFSGAALKESVLQQVLVESVDLVNAIRLRTRRCPRVEAPRRLQGSLRLPVRRYAALFAALLRRTVAVERCLS